MEQFAKQLNSTVISTGGFGFMSNYMSLDYIFGSVLTSIFTQYIGKTKNIWLSLFLISLFYGISQLFKLGFSYVIPKFDKITFGSIKSFLLNIPMYKKRIQLYFYMLPYTIHNPFIKKIQTNEDVLPIYGCMIPYKCSNEQMQVLYDYIKKHGTYTFCDNLLMDRTDFKNCTRNEKMTNVKFPIADDYICKCISDIDLCFENDKLKTYEKFVQTDAVNDSILFKCLANKKDKDIILFVYNEFIQTNPGFEFDGLINEIIYASHESVKLFDHESVKLFEHKIAIKINLQNDDDYKYLIIIACLYGKGKFMLDNTNTFNGYTNKHYQIDMRDTLFIHQIVSSNFSKCYDIYYSKLIEIISSIAFAQWYYSNNYLIIDNNNIPQIESQKIKQNEHKNALNLYVYPINQTKYTKNEDIITTFVNWEKNSMKRDQINSYSNINIFKISINKKETITEIDNPEYKVYEESKKELEDKLTESKISEVDQIKIIMRQLSKPHKKVNHITITKEVNCEKKNSCYKNIDSLYLRKNDHNKLMSILDKYKNHPEIYMKLGLRKKIGFLFHGQPGTGKSTTITTIACYLGKDIYYVDLSNIETNNDLQMIFDYATNKCANSGMLVFEDIDCMTNIVIKREKTTDATLVQLKEQEKLNLSYLLNLLDGTLSAEDCVFAITTNNKEILDEAIYRPGRIDVDIEFKLCDYHQIATIFKKYIDRDIDEIILKRINENRYSPAQIINHLQQYILSNDYSNEEIMKPFIDQ